MVPHKTPRAARCLKSTHNAPRQHHSHRHHLAHRPPVISPTCITPTGVDGVLETSPAAGPGPGPGQPRALAASSLVRSQRQPPPSQPCVVIQAVGDHSAPPAFARLAGEVPDPTHRRWVPRPQLPDPIGRLGYHGQESGDPHRSPRGARLRPGDRANPASSSSLGVVTATHQPFVARGIVQSSPFRI